MFSWYRTFYRNTSTNMNIAENLKSQTSEQNRNQQKYPDNRTTSANAKNQQLMEIMTVSKL